MRKLDLFGMILTIIGANIVIFNGLAFIQTPRIFFEEFPFYFRLAFICFIVGVSIIVFGFILRLISMLTKDKRKQQEQQDFYTVEKIMDYLNENKGKAFSANSLLKRIHWGSTYGISKKSIEKLLHDLIINDLINSFIKDGQKFYYTLEK